MEEIPEAQDGVCGADGNSFNDPFFQQDNEPMVRRNPSSCIEGSVFISVMLTASQNSEFKEAEEVTWRQTY